jgi:P-type E1-E2 ATPase
MLSGGAALEQYATRRASSALRALAKRMPTRAHRIMAEGSASIDVQDIVPGDILEVYPHEICPVDGEVIEGRGEMDESYLTGEPFEIGKVPGSQVLSGAVNRNTLLKIRATKLAVDSRYTRILKVVEEAEQNRPNMRRIADRLGAWYTPLALLIGVIGWLIGGTAERFLAVVVIATPCPLLIGIPVAIIGGISLAAKRGIVIKHPKILEQIETCQTFFFDKTGTLTYGRPVLTDIFCSAGTDQIGVLGYAASLEQYSRHPAGRARNLARALLARWTGIKSLSPAEIRPSREAWYPAPNYRQPRPGWNASSLSTNNLPRSFVFMMSRAPKAPPSFAIFGRSTVLDK